MKKILQIGTLLSAGLILTLSFQNCGSGLENASNSDIDLLESSEPPAGGENFPTVTGSEDVQASATTNPDFVSPGYVIGAGHVGDDKIAVSFHKGLKKRDRQGFSRVNYYYGKWNLFADGQYFATFTNTGQCGDTKQATCNINFVVEDNAVLKTMRSQLRKISITTINDAGEQSPRTDFKFAFIPPAPTVLPPVTPPTNPPVVPDTLMDDQLYRYDGFNVRHSNGQVCRIQDNGVDVDGLTNLDSRDDGDALKVAIHPLFQAMYELDPADRFCD